MLNGFNWEYPRLANANQFYVVIILKHFRGNLEFSRLNLNNKRAILRAKESLRVVHFCIKIAFYTFQ